MKIVSVKINNILSIEDAEIQFDDAGLVLVHGFNNDSGRANGAGKTAIFNAITFALFDKIPRKVTATEIVRRGSKSGYSEVQLDVDGDRYVVRRSRPKGVSFQKASHNLDITQEGFEQIIKLNYKQFILSMYAPQGVSERFLSVNDSDKKQFLLQLLNIEEFSSCKIIADQKVKSLEEQKVTLQSKMDAIDSKIDAYNESLVDENVFQYAIAEINKSILQFVVDLSGARSIVKPDLSKYQKLEEDILTKKTEFTRTKARREMLHEQYRKLKAKAATPFQGSDRCRTCGSSLDTLAAKTAHTQEVDQFLHDAVGVKSQIDECDQLLSKEQAVSDVYTKLREKKRDESRDFDIANSQAMELQSQINLKQQELKQLNLKLQNNLELESKIKDLSDRREQIVNNRDLISREIEVYKTVSAMYSPTGAQAYILDSVIESFNERVVEYINLLWSNMSYELKSYKENVKGDVTAKFSEHLVMDGKSISIGSLSGGEFRALSLCVDFALVDVMERQFGISLSPIILDEPFDGLDGSGKALITELLEMLAYNRQIVVVDHSSEISSMFSKVIKVEKQGGISHVSVET